MTTHSSILAWEIPWTEEPQGLQTMGSQRVSATKQPPVLLTFITTAVLTSKLQTTASCSLHHSY